MPSWYLFLVILTMASGFIFPICEWGGVMCLQYLPSAVVYLGTPSQVLPDKGGIWKRTRLLDFKITVWCEKEEGPPLLGTQELHGTACFLYDTYPVSSVYGKNALLSSVGSWSFIFFLIYFFPGYHGTFPNAAICKLVVLNLYKLGSCLR